jgi:hypothetical protein
MAILEASATPPPTIIDGKIISRPSARDELLAANQVHKTGFRGVVIYRPSPGHSILLNGARVITRASGRKNRHLSYYLVGYDEMGLLLEIFLGLVSRARNGFFRLRLALQRGVLKLANRLLSPGLSVSQRLAVVL